MVRTTSRRGKRSQYQAEKDLGLVDSRRGFCSSSANDRNDHCDDTDAAISGASRFRHAFQDLLNDAGRNARRLADTADLHDRLSFHGVKLLAPSLGEVTQIHVAAMGMMAQMALKDLGEKTRRGQLNRVLKEKRAGGLAYSYRVAAGDYDEGANEGPPKWVAVGT